MRKGLIHLLGRSGMAESAVPQRPDVEAAAIYASRLDRLLEVPRPEEPEEPKRRRTTTKRSA